MAPARKRLAHDLVVASPASSVKITKKSISGEARNCRISLRKPKRKMDKQRIFQAKNENKMQDLGNRVLGSLLDSCDKREVPTCHAPERPARRSRVKNG